MKEKHHQAGEFRAEPCREADEKIPKRYSNGSYEYFILQEGLMTPEEIELFKKKNKHSGSSWSGFSFCVSCIKNGFFTHDDFLKIMRLFDEYHYSVKNILNKIE